MEKENIIWNVPEVAKYLGCNVSSIRKISKKRTNSCMENTGANLILVKVVLINGLKNRKQKI